MPLDVRWLLPPGAPAEKVADAVQSFRVATGAKVTGASTLLMPLTGTHAGGDGDERLHQCGPLLCDALGLGRSSHVAESDVCAARGQPDEEDPVYRRVAR